MGDSILLLTVAGILLGVLPQLVSWAMASYGFHRGKWWPMVVSVPLAGLCFAALATSLYSPDSATVLQGNVHSEGRILVDQVKPGALTHLVLALIIQIGRIVSGK